MSIFDERFCAHPLAPEVLRQASQYLAKGPHSLTVTELMAQWSRFNELRPDTFDACMRMASRAEADPRFLAVLEALVLIQRTKDTCKTFGHEVTFTFGVQGAASPEGPAPMVTCIVRPGPQAALVQQLLRQEGARS